MKTLKAIPVDEDNKHNLTETLKHDSDRFDGPQELPGQDKMVVGQASKTDQPGRRQGNKSR